jgi:hypothetical protein
MRLLAFAVGISAALVTVAGAEEMAWFGARYDDGANLVYGIPESDYAPISFSCQDGSRTLAFVYEFEPAGAEDGTKVEVILQAGDILVPVETTGIRLPEIDIYLLEGATELDDRLADLLTSRGTLHVFVGDGAAEYPLDGAREAAEPLLATCGR